MNRIERSLENKQTYGILICDEGDQKNLISGVRRIRKKNLIPSQISNKDLNIPIRRIVEDPLFKTSDSSYFIQITDFIAFSLLRGENPQSNTHNLVQTAFNNLDKVLNKKAFAKDPKKKGIVRC